jgi:hypothetical protein
MEPRVTACTSCGAALDEGAGRCHACRRWQPAGAWDRALYYGFALLTALVMAVRWWLRGSEGRAFTPAELQQAWIHPLVVAPLALTAVYAVRVWRRR